MKPVKHPLLAILHRLPEICLFRSSTKFTTFAFSVSMTAKIFHIILALSVFFSTTGILMGKHFCKQEMLPTEVVANPKSCCQGKDTCGMKEGGCEKDCCSHEFEYFHSDQDKLVQTFELPTLHQPSLVDAILLSFDIEIPSFDHNTLRFQAYRPPIVQRNIPVLLQTFLI